MASTTSQVLPFFDFSTPTSLPVTERIARSIAKAREITDEVQPLFEYPCVPQAGASEVELQELEKNLGRGLPSEYREFLSMCRYLSMGDGYEVGGFDHDGVFVTEHPWISTDHRPDGSYLVIANYWRYADGDQLMIDLTEPQGQVVAYLHDDPLFEFFAPSFSLGLWRLVHEEMK